MRTTLLKHYFSELKLRYRDGQPHLLLSKEVRSVLFVTSNDITKMEENRRNARKVEAEAEYTNFLAHEVRNPLAGLDLETQY